MHGEPSPLASELHARAVLGRVALVLEQEGAVDKLGDASADA